MSDIDYNRLIEMLSERLGQIHSDLERREENRQDEMRELTNAIEGLERAVEKLRD